MSMLVVKEILRELEANFDTRIKNEEENKSWVDILEQSGVDLQGKHKEETRDLTVSAAASKELDERWLELCFPENEVEYQRLLQLAAPWREKIEKEIEEKKKRAAAVPPPKQPTWAECMEERERRSNVYYEGNDDNWYLWATPREAAWFAEQEWAKRRKEKKAKKLAENKKK